MYEKSAVLSQGDDITPGTAYLFGFEDAITYANTILETTEEHKRPFLSDAQLMDDYPKARIGTRADFYHQGARHIRDRHEEMLSASTAETIEEWKPQFHSLVIGWGHNYYSFQHVIGWYRGIGDGGYHEIVDLNNEGNIFRRNHIALIESSDEIGKPPSYFISRGKCTVRKEV